MTDADRIRDMLKILGWSQREAARQLDIKEREFRKYCTTEECPRVVLLALERCCDRAMTS